MPLGGANHGLHGRGDAHTGGLRLITVNLRRRAGIVTMVTIIGRAMKARARRSHSRAAWNPHIPRRTMRTAITRIIGARRGTATARHGDGLHGRAPSGSPLPLWERARGRATRARAKTKTGRRSSSTSSTDQLPQRGGDFALVGDGDFALVGNGDGGLLASHRIRRRTLSRREGASSQLTHRRGFTASHSSIAVNSIARTAIHAFAGITASHSHRAGGL